MFLLDVPRDPVAVGGGVVGLLVLAIVVLILVAILIVGFVILLKVLQRRKANAPLMTSGNAAQRNSPNQ